MSWVSVIVLGPRTGTYMCPRPQYMLGHKPLHLQSGSISTIPILFCSQGEAETWNQIALDLTGSRAPYEPCESRDLAWILGEPWPCVSPVISLYFRTTEMFTSVLITVLITNHMMAREREEAIGEEAHSGSAIPKKRICIHSKLLPGTSFKASTESRQYRATGEDTKSLHGRQGMHRPHAASPAHTSKEPRWPGSRLSTPWLSQSHLHWDLIQLSCWDAEQAQHTEAAVPSSVFS